MTANAVSFRPSGRAESQRAAPVVVLTYTGSGADLLHSALSASGQLTCTSGTGVLPSCHQAVTAWQAVDGQADGKLTPLAAASVRALATGLVTAIVARGGGHRWCEFAMSPPSAAETFLRLYPQTRFLIVHRRADTVIRSVLDASPWGLTGAQFAPFVSAHPASTVAALASYWAAHTAALLDFEQKHGRSCLCVRIEDLYADAAQVLLNISEFLALDIESVAQNTGQHGGNGDSAEPNMLDIGMKIPLPQIQMPMLDQLNELHRLLNYPDLTVTKH